VCNLIDSCLNKTQERLIRNLRKLRGVDGKKIEAFAVDMSKKGKRRIGDGKGPLEDDIAPADIGEVLSVLANPDAKVRPLVLSTGDRNDFALSS